MSWTKKPIYDFYFIINHFNSDTNIQYLWSGNSDGKLLNIPASTEKTSFTTLFLDKWRTKKIAYWEYI